MTGRDGDEGSLPPRVRIGYSVGSLVGGAFGTVPGLLLLPYLTNTMGVAAGLAGVLVFLPKAWDVVLNPLVGRLSDRTHTRWGARRPYLLFAGLAVAALFIAMFAAPFGASEMGGFYVAAMFLVTATVYAFFQVPYVAMPAEMTDSDSERTRMMTWRVAMLAITILVSGAGAPFILDQTGGGISGHQWMALFVSAMMVVGTLAVFFSTVKVPTGTVTASAPSLREQLRVASANRPFRVLLICIVLQATGVACMLTGVRYFAVYIMADPSVTTWMFLAVVSPALFTASIWRRIGERWGKARGYLIASITLTVATFALVATPLVPDPAIYVIVALMGFGYTGQQLFSFAILPDLMAAETRRTGNRQAGVFTGLWTAGETFGLALGPTIYGAVLGVFGYASTNTSEFVPQDPMAEFGVLAGFSLVPGFIVGLALLMLRRYRLDE